MQKVMFCVRPSGRCPEWSIRCPGHVVGERQSGDPSFNYVKCHIAIN